MSHDFAKKKKPAATKKPATKSQIPGWVWFVTGIATAVFLYFLAHLATITPQETSSATPVKEAKNKPKSKPVAKEPATETKFDFYTLLPEREVIVPEQRSDNAAEEEPQFQYILQAGSFRNAEDADRLRARLLLLNLEAKVEAVKSSNGDVWHRVQVGPFTSRSKMSKARSTLISERIDTMLIKRKIQG